MRLTLVCTSCTITKGNRTFNTKEVKLENMIYHSEFLFPLINTAYCQINTYTEITVISKKNKIVIRCDLHEFKIKILRVNKKIMCIKYCIRFHLLLGLSQVP